MSSPFNEEKYKRLLEGLEISEVLLSEVLKDNETKRIDSEYFKKEYLNFFKNIPNIEPLGNFVEDGYRVVYENTEIVESTIGKDMGFPYFLQATDLETPFIKTDNLFYVAEEDWKRYPKGRIKKGEILIEVKGKLEKVSIVPDDFPEKTLVSGSLFKMTVNNRINKHVLLCYLISKYGVAFKDRYKTNLLISYISKPDLYRIPVPKFSIQFQKEIDEHFQSIFKNQELSKSLYSEAEDILLSELGLKDWQPNNNPVNIKQLKESFLASGRLDAEYYQPKYDEIETAVTKYKHGYDIIGNLFAQNTDVCDYQEDAYNYIEIGDINISDGTASFNLVSKEELPDNAKRVLHTNDLLISKVRPYRGAVAIIDFDDERLIGSGAFTVLRENSTYKKEVLQILLRTQIYKDWLLKWNVGSSYPVIKDEDILNLPIPKIPNQVQTEIATYVQKSISLRNEAKQLLESAKLKVEDTISTPPHLIDNQLVIKYNKMAEESTYYYRLAEWTLLQELYAEKWFTTSTANYSIKNYSVCKSSGRLDAEYYQPKYDALFAQLSKYECDIIKDIAHIKKSVEPGSEAYQDSGVPFVRVSDVTKFGISEPNIYLSPSDFNLNELRPKKDTILLSKDGSVGIAYKIEEDIDCITSGALLHLSVFNKDYTPDYLTLVLNSIVVQMQAERDSNGAIIQHWKPSEIEQVIIPKLPKPIQETISAKIQESFALKAESKRLLDEAKMIVEREIEKGGK